MLEEAWSEMHDAPPEGFNLEFDVRREIQLQEDEELLKSNPSWKLPLPHTYRRSQAAGSRDSPYITEIEDAPIDLEADEVGDLVDASIGFDNDRADDFVDEMPVVPLEWDIQAEEEEEDGIIYKYQSQASQYGIEDDIPQEAPRVARRPPVDKRDIADMGSEKEKTAPWRKGKHSFEDIDGRFYAAGKKKAASSSSKITKE